VTPLQWAEQRLAERRQRVVEAGASRGQRRAQYRDLLFQRLQPVEFD
jgi:hypothetical protein